MAKLLVHTDVDTIEVTVSGKSPKAPQTEAYYIMREGFWKGNRLYPPNRITYIEVID